MSHHYLVLLTGKSVSRDLIARRAISLRKRRTKGEMNNELFLLQTENEN